MMAVQNANDASLYATESEQCVGYGQIMSGLQARRQQIYDRPFLIRQTRSHPYLARTAVPGY